MSQWNTEYHLRGTFLSCRVITSRIVLVQRIQTIKNYIASKRQAHRDAIKTSTHRDAIKTGTRRDAIVEHS